MKFAHLADVHIGGWREEELKNLTIESFKKAIEICIEENVGFVLICGDLFNTSIPQIDLIKETASILNKLRDNDIDVYFIPGSHDYSPSGKTMLDVLEEAGLATNVMKFKDNKLIFTKDKTGTKLTGMYGRRSSLETLDYQKLVVFINESFETESGLPIKIETNAVYGKNDIFYESKGSYSLFYTCNSWTNQALKSANQKAALHTLTDTGIFRHYSK
mgnify:CR=1 FL=1